MVYIQNKTNLIRISHKDSLVGRIYIMLGCFNVQFYSNQQFYFLFQWYLFFADLLFSNILAAALYLAIEAPFNHICSYIFEGKITMLQVDQSTPLIYAGYYMLPVESVLYFLFILSLKFLNAFQKQNHNNSKKLFHVYFNEH